MNILLVFWYTIVAIATAITKLAEFIDAPRDIFADDDD